MEIKNQFDNLLTSIKNIQKDTEKKIKDLPISTPGNKPTNIPQR